MAALNEKIQQFLDDNIGQSFSINEIIDALHIKKNYTTVYRHLQQLLKEGVIKKGGAGKSTKYSSKQSDVTVYLEKPFFERKSTRYNKNFLGSYTPNKTYFLTKSERLELLNLNNKADLSTDFLTSNKRLYETLLIDLSYSSSYLEGNTYSYLDTEVLIKYGEKAEGKSKEETQMVMNHKRAIEYIVKHKKSIDFNKKEIVNVHSLLGENLLPKTDLGVIRNSHVGIGGSAYKPMEDKYLLEDEFEIFLKKLNQIKDPFEQCIFILVFLPYFQLFKDINKRTARIFCNAPLIKNNLMPFSFLMVHKKEYVVGILSIYELNDVGKLKEVFLETYKKTYQRYFE